MYGAFSQLLYLCDLEEQRGGEGRDFSHDMGVRTKLYGMELTPLDTMLRIFSLLIALLLIDDVNHYMHLFSTVSNYFQYIIKLASSTKRSAQNAYKLFCHTETIKIKVIDSSKSENKLYSTVVVDSMTSNPVPISNKCKIKSAP